MCAFTWVCHCGTRACVEVTVHVRGRVRTRGERLVERWINRENRLVEILVDNTQTDKQTLKPTGLATNLSEKADIQTG